MDEVRLLNLLERVGTLLRTEERKTAATLHLHPVHLQVLRYLAQCNRYSNTPMAVSSYLGTTKGTTSQSLLVLQRHGYLQKESDPKDRRIVHLVLTPTGQALADNLVSSLSKEKILAKLNSEDLDTAQQVIKQLLRNLQRVNQHQPFGQCRTCRYLIAANDKMFFRCGLTQELLQGEETAKICHEHAFPDSDYQTECHSKPEVSRVL